MSEEQYDDAAAASEADEALDAPETLDKSEEQETNPAKKVDKPEAEEDIMKPVVEAALFAAGRPLDMDKLCALFVRAEDESEEANAERRSARKFIRRALKKLQKEAEARGIELVEVASGWRYQVRPLYAEQVSHLWATRPSRYSRAMLETLAIIAYRQPITRSEIETIRGVSVSTEIMKKMLEFNWLRVVGHRNTPGRPLLYGTTHEFLDHFGLKNLEELPPLAELQDLAKTDAELLRDSSDLEVLEKGAETGEAATEVPAAGADEEQKEALPVQLNTEEKPRISADLESKLAKAEEYAKKINIQADPSKIFENFEAAPTTEKTQKTKEDAEEDQETP